MKIALCLSGQARSFEAAYKFYEMNLFDYYQVDVFLHSWNSNHNKKIVDLYKPIAHKFEYPKFTAEDDKIYGKYFDPIEHKLWPPRNALSGFYSIYESNMLKYVYERDFDLRYDWVIRARFDYALNVVIPFKRLDNKKLYVPERSMICDQFAFSNSSIMDMYSSTYNHIDEFYRNGCWMLGEHLLSSNLNKHDIKPIGWDLNQPFKHLNKAHAGLIRDDHLEWINKS
jgi:hypothetical protein